MRLKLNVLEDQGVERPVAVVVASSAAVQDLAAALSRAPRSTGAGPRTLRVVTHGLFRTDRVLDPAAPVVEADLHSGATVRVVDVAPAASGASRGPVGAVLRVLSGPDAGREFPLPKGTSTIGRDPSSDVQLQDPLVSKRHARITIGSAVEIIDMNSANGVLLGGIAVQRTTLDSADVAVLGSTGLCVVRVRTGGSDPAPASVDLIRSPRVVARFPERELPMPELPSRPTPQPFPLLALIAPLIMGAVLFAVTRNPLSVLFTALSPLLSVGAYLDHKIRERRTAKLQGRRFEEGMRALEEELVTLQRVERAVREAEVPSTDDAQTAISQAGPLLWTHRREHREFLTVRLGTGSAPSRTRIEASRAIDTLPRYRAAANSLAARFAMIDQVPIVADLTQVGSVGIAGPHEVRARTARAVLMQLAAFHSPAEVVIAAMTSPTTRVDWEWLQWLPHTASPQSPLTGPHLADNPGAVGDLLARLEELLAARGAESAVLLPAARDAAGGEWEPVSRVALVLVVEDDCGVDMARITRFLERCPAADVHVVWCGASLARVPGAARAFVVAAEEDPATAGLVRPGLHVFPLLSERLELADANVLARTLAPVVDAGAMIEDAAGLPSSVPFVSLVGDEILQDAEFVEERWRANRSISGMDARPTQSPPPAPSLRAVVGATGTDAFALDLRKDGPHALVGGTTGAGKSEFLQSWVLGLATAYGPDRLAFLFVDYKGGSAFADCVNLPHTVGLVTDLSPHLVRRALTSLRAEVRHREHLLNRKGAKDLVSLEATGDPDAPPSLVIVVDEFAALVQEVPEFVDGVVDVAQRGRSLGLHLILATQRPAGVIKDNLRANTNLRVALRMADPEDSSDVIGDRLAYHFPASVPGRAAAKSGSAAPVLFQAAYAGGWTSEQSDVVPVEVERLGFDATSSPVARRVTMHHEPSGPNDVARIVATVSSAARHVGIREPRKPWLPELPESLALDDLQGVRTDEALLVGLVDRPEEQAQPGFSYRPDRDGNLAIYGTGGSGKSTALRTLAIAAVDADTGGPVQVYAIDYGAHGLATLGGLPGIGAVIDGEDDERVTRLLRMLRDLVDSRAVRSAAARTSTIGEYRAATGHAEEARILLLIDNFGPFRERYEFTGPGTWFTALTHIATDGRQVGVHLVVTGDRPNAVPPSIGATVQRRIVLRMAADDDYVTMGVPRDVLDETSPPGRGMVDGDEMQFAVLGGTRSVAEQAVATAALTERLRERGVPDAPQVDRLPESVLFEELPADVGGRPAIGVGDLDLEAVGIDRRGPFVIAGSEGSGRTSALVTVACALLRVEPRLAILQLDAHASDRVPRLPRSVMAVAGVAEAAAAATEVSDRLEADPGTPPVLVLPAVAEFVGSDAEFAIERLVRLVLREGGLVIAEGETATWTGYAGILQVLRAGKAGLLLAPSDLDADSVFGTSVGRVRRADFPPGRGFLIGRGRFTKLQMALPPSVDGHLSPSTEDGALPTVKESVREGRAPIPAGQ